MPFKKIKGGKGVLYVPPTGGCKGNRYNCPDCDSCQRCSDDRCRICLKLRTGKVRRCKADRKRD